MLGVLEARFGALGGDVTFVDAELEWLARTLVLRGLSIDLGHREVYADTLRLRAGWRDGGPTLERAEWLGGNVTLSRAMLTALEGQGAVEPQEAARRDLRRPPTLYVRDLDLALETPSHGDVRLGRVNLALRADAEGTPRLAGRFVPSFEEGRETAGEIWLVGALAADGSLEARGTARALRVSARDLPAGEPFDALRPFAPEFLVEFEGQARLDPRVSVLPELDLAARITDGRLQLPHLASPAARPLREVELAAAAQFRPDGPGALWSPAAWDASLTASAQWEATRLEVCGRFGAAEGRPWLADAAIVARDLELGEALLELGGHAPDLVEVHTMLAPDGRADLVAGLRLPRDWRPEQGAKRLEQAVAVLPRGAASMAYHGAPSRRTGLRDEGFPLRVQGLRGLVTWTYHPADEYPVQLGLHACEGRHPGGPVHVVGSLHEIPGHLIGATPEERRERRPFFPSLFHLRIESDALPVDDELERGFRGLAGVPPVGEIGPLFGPRGGSLAFALQLWRVPGRLDLATDLVIDIQRVGFRWRELPLPLEDVEGLLVVRSDGRGPELGRTVVSIDARGTSPAARGAVTVTGRTHSEGKGTLAAAFDVRAEGVNTRSRDLRDVLLEKQPGVLGALDAAGVAGFVDVAVTTSDPLGSDATTAWVAVTTAPEGARLMPEAFATPTEGVHGRVLVTAAMPAPRAPGQASDAGAALTEALAAETSGRAIVRGTWPDAAAPVALAGDVRFEHGARPVLAVVGAGLEITNTGVLGSVADVVRRRGGSGDPLDPDALDVDGRFDFAARYELPEAPGAPPGSSELEVDARLDHVGFDGKRLLSDVSAHFKLVEATGEWIGERISAELGTTPVRLDDLRWTPTAGGSRVSTRLAADDLPLDREHLELFVDRETLDRLVEDLELTGSIDVRDTAVVFERGADGVDALHVDGRVDVDEMRLVLGVPLELEDVDDVALSLRLEGEAMRAHASVRGLDGKLAGRRLDDARVEVSYVEPRLALTALDGRFEGGRIAGLGEPGAQFFAMDVVAPFPFELGARLTRVDVGEFLRGALNSDFANEGRMDLDVALSGDIERLTAIRGSGRVAIDETRLWAIPVFQALFARLGFPTTAVFRQIVADFRVQDGALHIDRTRADSDLLSIVGSGTLDFAGDLSTDLEVRYGIVDRLGPFTRLLYKIQNSLLRVAIRGTLERPVVVLRGLFSQFFRPADARDRLPLPGFSELPRRF